MAALHRWYFFMWQHRSETLNAVMKRLNKFHSTAKFTAEYFEKSVPFLDVTTNIENKVLKTDLFSKSYGHTPIQSSF